MFSKVLIANRGEIASRVASTCKRMGIATVAVYSDADAQSKHVAVCDEAVHIGPAPARESYLSIERILGAAKQSGAQAVHPGYGFLSENEQFAEACADAKISFIGPPASAISAMGMKSASKLLMAKAGVPLVPGYHGEDQDPGRLKAEAAAIGYPVMLKASAGGGGRGIRVVETPEAFDAALAACKREAKASFGDEAMLIEKYLARSRHIEIQIFADSHGNFMHLAERDCSLQRRHQKVIEEAPAPRFDDRRRQAMSDAAIAAARAVGYIGAGTVEFIAAPTGEFYFMEMNTRLQVEHPVTELITGLDLVEWQLRVAAGQPLPLRQHELALHGHALEARIYAERPEKGFLPSTGTLSTFHLPAESEFWVAKAPHQPITRVDSGFRQGDTVSPYYDALLAKLLVHGKDRDEAIDRMVDALKSVRAEGVHTNVAFLTKVFASEAFRSGDVDTALISRNIKEFT